MAIGKFFSTIRSPKEVSATGLRWHASVRRVVAIGTAAFVSTGALADFEAQVIGVADGDTLTVRRDSVVVKVRLTEIDAPEKTQPFGNRSRKSLADLCFGKVARLVEAGRDRYGRTLARVYCAGTDANATQIHRGMAWAFIKYLTDPDIKSAEDGARAAHTGLWSDPAPVAPWDWRAAGKVRRGSTRD